MIISASRRTDIPAFYAEWFMNRVRTGFCDVPNPFNANQVSRVSLAPENVDVIVFWTRNPLPLLPHLAELEERGFRTFFLFTVMGNPRAIDPGCPSVEKSIATFRRLSGLVGPDRITWRYDPILFTKATDAAFHLETYRRIARALRGRTERSVISIAQVYRKNKKRLMELEALGAGMIECEGKPFDALMRAMADEARENGMGLFACAQERDFTPYGIEPGKCIDGKLLCRVFGLDLKLSKDPSQRKECGCVASKDIGMYDTCLFGCKYCYATTSIQRASENHRSHDPLSPSLIGRTEGKLSESSRYTEE